MGMFSQNVEQLSAHDAGVTLTPGLAGFQTRYFHSTIWDSARFLERIWHILLSPRLGGLSNFLPL